MLKTREALKPGEYSTTGRRPVRATGTPSAACVSGSVTWVLSSPTPARNVAAAPGVSQGTARHGFRAAGYRVDCVGIGAEQAVPIPLTASDDEDSYLRDDAGRRVTTTFNQATLVRVAATTGGRYVRSTTGSELARAIADVVNSDRRILGWRSATEYRDLYPVGLAVAAVAAAALWLLV